MPTRSSRSVLDTSLAGASETNRWNGPGAPTLYLAGDRGVAITEWARHVDRDLPEMGSGTLERRSLYAVALSLAWVLDLRDRVVTDRLGLADAPACFVDRSVARATADFIRLTTRCQGIVVPSVAFLDDLSRWNLVVFLEKLPGSLDSIAFARPVGSFGVADLD